MSNSYSQQMLKCVKNGTAELAFVNLPVEDDELCIEPCFQIHDIFVCNTEHKTKKSYTRQEISEEPLILLETNSTSRNYIDDVFKKDDIILEPQIEIAAHDLLIRFASISLGVSCVIKEFSKDSLEHGIVKEMKVNPPIPPRNIGYAYMKNTPLSPPAREFLRLIKNI